ncbi:MAG: hypothetical protein EP346_06910 [Bacteroidetes bacterium]|nr:MAG: hypothetical protein EP346_06910 [Bacteroidota bacterium]
MTSKYSIEILKHNVRLVATYKTGHLKRIEITRGKFDPVWFARLSEAIPVHETSMDKLIELWSGKLTYELITPSKSSPTLFKRFNDAWFDFYMDLIGARPKFSGADGNALKSIIKYLKEECSSEDEALATWNQILQNWHKLDAFTQKKTELIYINSHLNSIIAQLKNGFTSREKAASAADSLRRGN